jgi:hypothetical protein
MARGMSAIVDDSIRNSRWSRDPVIRQGGAARMTWPTERDIEIFRLLVRFRYLPSDYIHAFVGGSEKALSHRLNLLSRKPNLYLARPQQQRQSAAANYRHLIYELDERGRRVLRERGVPFSPKPSHHNFAHELMTTQIIASIALGVQASGSVKLISWNDILAHPATPIAVRESPTPTAIRVSYSHGGRGRCDEITADAEPFGLQRIIDGKPSYLFFPGIEADCGSEPLATGDADRSSIARKFAMYLAIAEQGLHRSYFGFPNFFVPFITTSAARLASMVGLVNQLTMGRGSKNFLFKTFPSFTSAERPPPATGHMLTEPWQRVGFPPFCLDR